MIIRDLYKLTACTSFVSRYLWVRKEEINFNTVNMSWFSFKKERKLHEKLYGDIEINVDKTSIYMNTGTTDNLNQDLINTKISDGFWVLKDYCCGNKEFKWYQSYEESKKFFKTIRIHSIFHPNSFVKDKYFFIYKNGQFALLNYQKESSVSRNIYFNYCKFIRNPILSPISNFYHQIKYKLKGK